MNSDDLMNEHRRVRRANGSPWIGFILILLGIIILLQRLGGYSLRNWWALFILIPAFASLAAAVTIYQRSGRFNSTVSGNIFGGLIICTVAILFLFELNWAVYWPLFVLLPGLSILVSALAPSAFTSETSVARTTLRPWSAWIGLSAALLGGTFLLRNLGMIAPQRLLINWWAISIILPGIGGLINTLRLYLRQRDFGAEVIANLVGALIFCIVGIVSLLGMNWELLWPLFLIGAGILLLLSFFVRQK